ncbi:MAG: hypothetical protein LBM12_01645 [Candidatus Nomurabacteria bacterium]|nr:hypothetical protein [Candidatus Nomurabacteria bacterium]
MERLKADYPQFKWRIGARFRWRPATRTITVEKWAKNDRNGQKTAKSAGEGYVGQKYALLTLHELAHALLGHKDDSCDVLRLKCEAEAWEKVKSDLCGRYGVAWDEEFAQDNLDTYRAWLHKKSACPVCKQCRLQTKTGEYVCLNGC